MTWTVRARDVSGVTRQLTRSAATQRQLLDGLREEGFLVLRVEEAPERHPGAVRGWAGLRPMSGFDVELGLRQIASLLRSGIPLLAAVETVAEEALSPRARRTWERVAGRIVAGGDFSSALAQEPRHFSELVVRLCEVGEKSGELSRTVARAADQMEHRRNLRSQVVNALTYPFLAVALAVGVGVFLVVAVIPRVAEFLKAGGAELPALTQTLMDVSNWINLNGLLLLAGVVAAAVAWKVVGLAEAGRELEDALLLKIPVTGRILRLSATALFARSMQIMTESGVALLEALSTASRLMGNRRCRRRVAAAHDAVLAGRTLAEGLAPAREFTPMLRRMAAVGETTGAMPEAFDETARFHELLLALAVRRFGMLIEPVLIVVTGAIVGFVYLAFFMAIFALAGAN